MDVSRSTLVYYVVPVLGAILFAVGIGWAVISIYGTFQAGLGLCGHPYIQVFAPSQPVSPLDESPAGPDHPNFPTIDYEELTPSEQRAFQKAIGSVQNTEVVNPGLEHGELFEEGAIVRYQGDPYYVAIRADNKCVPAHPLWLPLGVSGVLIGGIALLSPGIWKLYQRIG